MDLPLKLTRHSEMSAERCAAKCPRGVADSLAESEDRNLLTLKEQNSLGEAAIYYTIAICQENIAMEQFHLIGN